MSYTEEQYLTPGAVTDGSAHDASPFFDFNVPGTPFAASPDRQPGASGGMPPPIHCSPQRSGGAPVASPPRPAVGPLGGPVVQQYGGGSDPILDDSQFNFGGGDDAPSFWNPALMTPGGGMGLEILPGAPPCWHDGSAPLLLTDRQRTAGQEAFQQQLAASLAGDGRLESLLAAPLFGVFAVRTAAPRQAPPPGTNPDVIAAAMLALGQGPQQVLPMTPQRPTAATQLLEMLHQGHQHQAATAGEAASPGSSASGAGLPPFRGSPGAFHTPPRGPHLPVTQQPPSPWSESAYAGPDAQTPAAPHRTGQAGTACRRTLFPGPSTAGETVSSAH